MHGRAAGDLRFESIRGNLEAVSGYWSLAGDVLEM